MRRKKLAAVLGIILAFAGCSSEKAEDEQSPEYRSEEEPEPAAEPGQLFTYVVTGSEVTVTGYTGSAAIVRIPESIDGLQVTRIEDFAFYRSRAAAVILPEGLSSIGIYAFWQSALNSVSIPPSVSEIRKSAFAGCMQLAAITVSPENPHYTAVDGVLFTRDGTTLHTYPAGAPLSRYSIPEGVSRIEEEAFRDAAGLAQVTIPPSVTEIGAWAFLGCRGLTTVTIPASSVDIGSGAFSDCLLLQSVSVHPENPAYTAKEGILYSHDMAVLHTYPAGIPQSSFTLPESVAVIGDSAFMGAWNLAEVVISEKTGVIGSWAFSECDALTRITIPRNVRYVGGWAFAGCDLLEEICCRIDSEPELWDSRWREDTAAQIIWGCGENDGKD